MSSGLKRNVFKMDVDAAFGQTTTDESRMRFATKRIRRIPPGKKRPR